MVRRGGHRLGGGSDLNREDRYRARRQARVELHAARGPIDPQDVVVTIVLLVVATIALPVVTTLTTVLATGSGCVTAACTATTGAALWLGLLVPLLTVFVGIAVCVARLVRHRRGWAAAVVTIAGVVLCLPLAGGLAAIGRALS